MRMLHIDNVTLFWLIVCSTIGWVITAAFLAWFIGKTIRLRDNDGIDPRTKRRKR